MDMTRREFIAAAGAVSAAARAPRAFGAQTGRGQGPSPAEVDAIFSRAVVFDALSADERWQDAQSIFAAYKLAGLTAIHTSLANRNLAVAQRDLAAWQQRLEQWPDRLSKITRAADVAEAKKTGRVGVLLGFQNATIVESDIRNLQTLYDAGTRCIQLTYNTRNLLGDGCTERTNAGLSHFGVAVVERMSQLGIIVDLSHCGEATSRDGIRFSRRPPAFTHTMCGALYDHVRAKSDDLLEAMSDKGGMTGILTLGYFIGPSPDTSLDDYLRHVDHAVRIAGIDHVGLASDYSIRGIGAIHTRESWYVPRLSSFPPEYRVRWPPWIKELDQPERFRHIAHGLAKRGYTSTQLEKLLGGNWVRYLGDAIG
jgi:membrane dipeptidase